MTLSDYLINAFFVLIVLRQASEREVGLRSLVVPLVIVFLVARQYVHSIPTSGNDVDLVAALAAVGLMLGTVGGFATRLRLNENMHPVARVRWVAGSLLMAGISARMVFAFVVSHGAEPVVRSFSIAHQIGAAAWPVALVSMALLEVSARLVTVQLRARRLVSSQALWAPPARAT